MLVNAIYGNTFKARSQTIVNKQKPISEISFCRIPFAFYNRKRATMMNVATKTDGNKNSLLEDYVMYKQNLCDDLFS